MTIDGNWGWRWGMGGMRMGFFEGAFGALIGLLWLAVLIGVGVWIYRDATQRGMRGGFWVLALLFTNVLGALFIYLAVRDNFPKREG